MKVYNSLELICWSHFLPRWPTLIPSQSDKSLCWDITVTCPMSIGWFMYHWRSPESMCCDRACCFLYWCPVSLRVHCSWDFGRHQHYSSWTTMVGVWLLTLARLERLASCISGGYRGGSPTAVQAWQPCPLWEPSP